MQKITPFIWFDANAEEAMRTYVSLFRNGEIVDTSGVGPEGTMLLGTARIAGSNLMFLNGGPDHPITPAISFTVGCESRDELDTLWAGLAEGGMALMELGKYPFAERFGWIQDRFGVSWQLILTGQPQSFMPTFLFVGDQFGKAKDAIELYTSVFPDSRIGDLPRGENGAIANGRFWLAGQPFSVTESDLGHPFTFTDAVSFSVDCADQTEVDRCWDALTANGGAPAPCGWLTDPFGVSWQIVPRRLGELMNDPDQARVGRTVQAMLQMSKLVIADLETAANAG
ncbi:MAG TPA: VOC family protein [Thermomicrobiales bacterium]|nr:VOC family protein [Thermomicrobiales bacterium]